MDSEVPTDSHVAMSPEQKRLIAILEYLVSWDKLTRTPISDVEGYGSGVLLYQAGIDGLPGINTNVAHGGEDVWLEVSRLQRVKPPLAPEQLKDWLRLSEDPNTAPILRDSIPMPSDDPEGEPVLLKPSPDIQRLFADYRDRTWAEWSKSEKPRRQTISLYEKLFHLQQRMETESAETPLEFVWGMGMVLWKKSGLTIRHPLITQQVEFLPLEGDMTLRVRPTTREALIEADPFLPLELPELASFERTSRETLRTGELVPSPFETTIVSAIARAAAERFDTSGAFLPEDPAYVVGSLPSPSVELKVTDSWVLFDRRRSSGFLVQDLRKLQEAIDNKGVPEGAPQHLVRDPSGEVPVPPDVQYRGLSSDSTSEAAETRELYFPKPFNNEQVEIIRRLDSMPGVVVQGPPGTGKTHTIGNVICHYLAQGKRILVTSKGEAALAVVRQQIPEEIRHLTVGLLTNEREGIAQLENAINHINSRLLTLRESDLNREIAELGDQIEGLHRKISAIDSRLKEWARKNTTASPDSIGALPPEELAKWVAEKEDLHGWFPDELNDDGLFNALMRDEDLVAIASARKQLKDRIEYLGLELPVTPPLLTAAEIVSMHGLLAEKSDLDGKIADGGLPRFPAEGGSLVESARTLLGEIREHCRLIRACEEKWLGQLRDLYRKRHLSGQSAPVADAMDALRTEVESVSQRLEPFVATSIEFDEEWHTDTLLIRALERVSAGARPFSFLQMGVSVTRQRFTKIRVNGSSPSSREDWKSVLEYLKIHQKSRELVSRWNKLCGEIDAPAVTGNSTQVVKELIQHAQASNDALLLGVNYDLTFVSRVQRVFPNIDQGQIRHELTFLEMLERALQAQLRRLDLSTALRDLGKFKSRLQLLPGSLFSRMLEWLDSRLGDHSVPAASIEREWLALLDELVGIERDLPLLETVSRVTAEIERCGAPFWAGRLRCEPAEGEEDPWAPISWREAWLWSRRRGYLQKIDGRADVLRQARERRDAEKALQRSYENVVEKRTWSRLVVSLKSNDIVKRAITAYLQAIRGMTKSGKGKRDARLRQDAREAMGSACGGVPCWIMPHWRIAEALPPILGDFDLVIIDEASQSDAWAIPALLRGKQVLIVGDDKQVGPPVSFLREEQANQLIDRLKVNDVPSDICRNLHPSQSIYDLGELIFSGQTIRLREHFRCAEPIIEFSNKLCYNREIRCVRVPGAEERLVPTLVDVHVRTGRRLPNKKINLPEADAIIAEIQNLIGDPDFGKRSIGVVSLLGAEQARHIMDKLIDEIGEDAYLKHRIRCGDARTFQGSEADVIFLSAVDDAESGGVMTENKIDNVRRINVAVSRARDRLYFYHSFAREDLSGVDLRARLLDHFRSPLPSLQDAPGGDVFESPFERAMFDELVRRGYRVLPQVRAGNHRIDLVVEGHEGRRLAVECDGDRYHGPDKWMEDIGRQRVLERAGWKFWRCWGSSFYANRDACLEDLVLALEAEGIEPIGGTAVDASGLVEFLEVVEDNEIRRVDAPSSPPDDGSPGPSEHGDVENKVQAPAPAQSGGGSEDEDPDEEPNQDEDVDETRPGQSGSKQEGDSGDDQRDGVGEDLTPASLDTRPISVGDQFHYRIHENGRTREFTLTLSEQSTNLGRGIIDVNSDFGRLFLGRSIGDRFSASSYQPELEYEILRRFPGEATNDGP
jgi:very-short-patch-repair endonuclease